MKHMTWTAAALGLAATLATPAAALECAEGTRAFAHMGGETCIPEQAQRIVSLHDQQITMTLIEVGAPVVGSHGRPGDGTPFIRGVRLVHGIDFSNSDIAYVGTWDAMDFEAIAGLNPDLIIGRQWEIELRDQYEAIAPTVFIPVDGENPLAFARGVADAAGRADTWDRMHDAFQATLERARVALPQVAGQTYSKIQGWDGELNVFARYGASTYILAELGMQRTPFAQEMADRGVAWGEVISAELLPELQADYIFDTYTIAYNDTMAAPIERMNGVFPGWCDVLTACAEGRYIILPREYASGFSFAEMNTAVHLITTNIANAPAPAS
ncbi:MAG: ABC transporter substrate-binding protein [Pseudomonadota bacterium]